MDKIIKADLYRYNKLKGTKGFFKGLMIPGFRYTYIWRMAGMSKRKTLKRYFFLALLRRYSFKYGFQINIDAEIGEGFFIGHFGLIGVNPEVKIGKNCNIAHLVTIGQANRGKRKGSPKIGDHVWIGTGSVIVGKIEIGSNVLIAPNSFVNVDVPPNSIVLGNPCQIISKENPCDGYINNILSE